MSIIMKAVVEFCEKKGFNINYNKGKTEIMIFPGGKE